MVKTALAIERVIEDTQGIRDVSAGGKRKENQPSSSLGKRRGLMSHERPRYRASQGR